MWALAGLGSIGQYAVPKHISWPRKSQVESCIGWGYRTRSRTHFGRLWCWRAYWPYHEVICFSYWWAHRQPKHRLPHQHFCYVYLFIMMQSWRWNQPSCEIKKSWFISRFGECHALLRYCDLSVMAGFMKFLVVCLDFMFFLINRVFYVFLIRCTLDPGDKILDCPPTFTMYAFDAAVNGASVIKGALFLTRATSYGSVIAVICFLL